MKHTLEFYSKFLKELQKDIEIGDEPLAWREWCYVIEYQIEQLDLIIQNF